MFVSPLHKYFIIFTVCTHTRSDHFPMSAFPSSRLKIWLHAPMDGSAQPWFPTSMAHRFRQNPPPTMPRSRQPHQWLPPTTNPITEVTPRWSIITESPAYHEKLLLLCHSENELVKAGYVVGQLGDAQLEKKVRCQKCNGKTTWVTTASV
jgi:hypothetical protein